MSELVAASARTRLSIRALHVLAIAVAVVFTFFLHEGAHWAAGELLGNDMGMTLNAAYPLSREYVEAWHESYVAAAGPLATILQAVLVFVIFLRQPSVMTYPFLLSPVIMRVLAAGVNVVARPQDEARVGLSLGIGSLTLPLIVCAFLVGLAVYASRRQGYSWRFNALSVVLVIFFSSVVILAS